MTRIIAGAAGGRRLRTPPGQDTRPTTDRVREALFSALGDVGGARVLDLFAGSGALGLEAASRGAARVTFVESGRAALAALRRNVADLELPGTEVVAADVSRFLAGRPRPHDLVLADPPYATAPAPLLELLVGWLVPGARVVLERGRDGMDPDLPVGLELVRRRDYGGTSLWYLRST
jgi:16S rRNA (guanine966-N2)-methyltransferase